MFLQNKKYNRNLIKAHLYDIQEILPMLYLGGSHAFCRRLIIEGLSKVPLAEVKDFRKKK